MKNALYFVADLFSWQIFGLLENISFSYSASLGPTADISGDNETLFVADKKIGVLKVMRPKTWCFVWSTYIVKSYHCSGVTKNVQKKGSVKYDVLWLIHTIFAMLAWQAHVAEIHDESSLKLVTLCEIWLSAVYKIHK